MYFHGLLIDNPLFFIDEKKDQAHFLAFPRKWHPGNPFICLKKNEKALCWQPVGQPGPDPAEASISI
jgi:hypothetical protein